MANNLKNVTKLALFAQTQSLKLLLLQHFIIFLLEIFKLASQLNLAAILLFGFLNLEFGAILVPFERHFPGN